MGEQLMRIINLKIIKLHKYFNYNVDFNNDVTFIYGSNGCGKTTILNITEYIITGNLYRLFEYEFERIVLKYEPIKSIGDIREILIEKNSSNITVNFDGNTEKISRIEGFHGRFPEELDGIYLKQYSILRRIRDSFNYVYLPLNRKTVLYDLFSVRNRNFRSHNHILKNDEEELGRYYFDQAINDVEILIKECYSRTSMMISKINNDFRNKILKSSIEVLSSFDTNEFVKQIASSSSISDIKKTKKSFIKIAREIELLSPDEESIYDKFFQDYIDELTSIKDNKEIRFEIIAKFQDISRIKKIVSMAEEMEMQKEQYLKPIELFLGTINNFIKTADDEKEFINLMNCGVEHKCKLSIIINVEIVINSNVFLYRKMNSDEKNELIKSNNLFNKDDLYIDDWIMKNKTDHDFTNVTDWLLKHVKFVKLSYGSNISSKEFQKKFDILIGDNL